MHQRQGTRRYDGWPELRASRACLLLPGQTHRPHRHAAEPHPATHDTPAAARSSFIRGAQRLGLRLAEIRELLAVPDTGACPCEPAEGLARRNRFVIVLVAAAVLQLLADAARGRLSAAPLRSAGADTTPVREDLNAG